MAKAKKKSKHYFDTSKYISLPMAIVGGAAILVILTLVGMKYSAFNAELLSTAANNRGGSGLPTAIQSCATVHTNCVARAGGAYNTCMGPLGASMNSCVTNANTVYLSCTQAAQTKAQACVANNPAGDDKFEKDAGCWAIAAQEVSFCTRDASNEAADCSRQVSGKAADCSLKLGNDLSSCQDKMVDCVWDNYRNIDIIYPDPTNVPILNISKDPPLTQQQSSGQMPRTPVNRPQY